MATYTTTSGQTLFDLSVQLYGNSSSVIKLLVDNTALAGIGKLVPAGSEIEYTPPEGFTVAQFLTDKRRTVNTGNNNPLQGSGFDLGFTLNGFN